MYTDELHPMLARIRIAALQSEVRSKSTSPSNVVVRSRRNTVTQVITPDGTPSLAVRRVVSARRN
ncbi:hypothetical protein VHEMI07173 [[Torrubiella] hemipterigena]|uniref:Uncharacterized protein n=1 Tax=[Torrubiella] hemipterigena TaxID=1531966 RepID=A0A0A1TL51_9HYPO|nr:hypothetical protein VHEMI07173 [[Torrubiella] hemipterigena]